MAVVHPPAPTVETERLILRLPQLGDFDDYAELLGDPQAAHYIGGQLPRAAAWRRFLQMPGAWAVQGFAMFSVVEKSSGHWVGQMGPWHPEGWPGTEIGWAFKRSSWGNGYALEAAVAAIDWTFANLDWHQVIHSIHPDNAASQRLAERLGSVNRGPGRLPAPFEESPIDVWGQTRAHWMETRGRAIKDA